MESQYGIGITNRYAMFLDNEDDPADVLKAEVKDDKKKGKIAEKENRGKVGGGGGGGGGASAGVEAAPGQKPVSTTAPAPRKGIQDSNKPRTDVNRASNKPAPNAGNVGRPNRPPRTDGQGPRGPRANDDDREDRNNRRNVTRDESGREPRPEGEYNRGPRRGGGGGGRGGQFGDRPRGAPSGRGRGPPGTGLPERKREFDRKSGSDKSGVKPIDKRDGAGSHNWGTYKDDLQGAENTVTAEEPVKEEGEAQPTEATESTEEKGEQNDVENVEPAVEEGPKTMTLEEWKALQQPREKPVFNLRKAGEGEDQTQWKKMILKKKEKPDSGDEEEYEEEEHYEVLQRAGRQKQILDIDFHFTDSRRGGTGGGRGGRGGPRGGGGRDGGGRDGGGRDGGGREGGGRDGGVRGDREGGPPGERGERRGPRPPRNPTGPSSGPPGGFNKNPRTNRFGNAPRSQAAPKVDDENDFPTLG